MSRTLLAVCGQCLSASLILMALGESTEARGFRVNMIPNGRVNRCSNCHISEFGAGPRTPFGEAVRDRVTAGGAEVFWNAALAGMDSDGDGRSNGEELLDPLGDWSQGDSQPGDPADVTNPGVAPPPLTLFIRGDANADSIVELSDAVSIFSFLFLGGAEPPCLKAGDANNDGVLDLSDGVGILGSLFLGGPDPLAPYPDCGVDPTKDSLACDSYPLCNP